ncbi:hypothetical protein CCACVL1_01212 [Corchorus capsularis]|uniref:Pentatricopeptide repeat-containing protein n=1 Tax=Corchorus capsularis TaxID=210143 RepID=A0A1R3KL68_COCAP|nr:hypothetical protein CCACVL1_01212 [Corchorus capsularis]
MADKDGVHRIWKKMKSSFRKMNDAEYTCMISSLVKLGDFEEAEKLYSEWESVSGTGDARVPNILLAAYINGDQMEKAENFYQRIVEKGEVFKKLEELGDTEGVEKLLVVLRNAGHVSTKVYNSLLRAYANAGKMPLIVADRMEKDNVPPDEETHELIKLTSKMCISEVSGSL